MSDQLKHLNSEEASIAKKIARLKGAHTVGMTGKPQLTSSRQLLNGIRL